MGRRIRKTTIITDKNRKPKAKLEKTLKPTEKPQFLRAKTENPNQKYWPNPQTENPTAPLLKRQEPIDNARLKYSKIIPDPTTQNIQEF